MKPIFTALIILTGFFALAGKSYNAGTDMENANDSRNANANGKYMSLLHVLKMPGDRDTYGDFCDWGYYGGNTWADITGLRPGFWVYVYPNWYIWEKLTAEDGLDPVASVNGKYSLLLYVISVPDDAGIYGDNYDFGFWEGYAYAGYENLSPGYWVYSAPNWYIWGEVSGSEAETHT